MWTLHDVMLQLTKGALIVGHQRCVSCHDAKQRGRGKARVSAVSPAPAPHSASPAAGPVTCRLMASAHACMHAPAADMRALVRGHMCRGSAPALAPALLRHGLAAAAGLDSCSRRRQRVPASTGFTCSRMQWARPAATIDMQGCNWLVPSGGRLALPSVVLVCAAGPSPTRLAAAGPS